MQYVYKEKVNLSFILFRHPPPHMYSFPFYLVQAKFSDLDLRRNTVSEEHETLTEKLNVLKANADKIDPNKKKVTTTETVR